MDIHFSKYQGTGNDFVIIDNRSGLYSILNINDISFLCDRKFGIGADGLILLEEDDNLDFRMRYFNSDGREASMCGNGGRCIVAFAKQLNIIEQKTKFMAFDGSHEAIINNDNHIELRMGIVSKIEEINNGLFLDTGSPHFVKFIDNISLVDVNGEGKRIRNQEEFSPDGTNVNFVELTGKDTITVKTYERGVESETLSCGTGVVAAAVCTFLSLGLRDKIYIDTSGGKLSVRYRMYKNDKGNVTFDDIWLCGKVGFVYNGIIEVNK